MIFRKRVTGVSFLRDPNYVSLPEMSGSPRGSVRRASGLVLVGNTEGTFAFCAGIFGAGRRFDLVRTRANCQLAFGAYLRSASGISHGIGLYVLTLSGDRISAMTRFENSVIPWFDLPRSFPSR
jgi:hypothetical protein